MEESMQAGKIYRLRPMGALAFTEGYYEDNCFYDGGALLIGRSRPSILTRFYECAVFITD